MAYFFVQPFNRQADVDLIRRFSESSNLKVTEAKHDLHIEPGYLYMIPGDQEMELSDGAVVITRGASKRQAKNNIDRFFISVSREHKGGIIGIILSGEGSDGTIGLKAIKIAGGITFTQDETAVFDEMPRSAISAGVVDYVLSASDIGRELGKICQQKDLFLEIQFGTSIISDSDESLLNIIQLLKKAIGVDFTHYKMSTIKRRIIRRMLLYKLKDLKAYNDYLKRHASEISVLYHDLLINVTCFFRDNDSTEYLKKVVLPEIIRSKSPDDNIRIWIPACSTGEEAYSLAILLAEIQEESKVKIPIQIFGTDLSEVAISKARLGIYTADDLVDMSEARINKYFVSLENGGYRVDKNVREICIFAQHNIFKDPPFSRLDLISCCNFFIYLDTVLQQKSTTLFYYALNPNGYLVLGKSETIISSGQQLFSQVEKKFKVYRKKADASPKAPGEMNYRLPVLEPKEAADRKKAILEYQPELSGLEKHIDDLLYAKYIPAAVVVNQEMEILQFRGSTNLFLEPSRGKASFNLMKMARPSLTFDLRNCIHKAQTTRTTVRKTGIKFSVREQEHFVTLEVIPLLSKNEDRLLLIIFEEQQMSRSDSQADYSKDELVLKLQDELGLVRNDMQAIIDEHEANKEELQSANEEIISSNEELQSINEELETSKEEVESANEELRTINAELQMSNDQLLESQEYAEAIFATIREAVVVLNTDFRVKMANASFYRTFLIDAQKTEGRLLYDIGEKQWNRPEIKELVNNILLHDQYFDGYEMLYHLPNVGPRTMLVNGRKVVQKANRQELILLAFEDITDRRKAQMLISEREEWFRNMANNAPVMIWTAAPDGLRNFFNVTWLSYTGRNMEEEMADGWVNDVFAEDKEIFLSIYNNAFQDKLPFTIEYRLRRFDGEYRWVKAIGKPSFSTDGQFTGFVGICSEIHDSKLMQNELEELVNRKTHDLQELNKELKKSNAELQQFAYVASHDLQEPLRKIMIFSDRLNGVGDVPLASKNYIEKIMDSAQRMSQLIKDLLEFSRLTKTNDHFRATNLADILKTVLANFELLVKEKNAIILADNLLVIEAIPFQMEQLFHNLISNALKFSKPKVPPVIRITCHHLSKTEIDGMEGLDGKKDYVELIFEDNGIGFSTEYSEQIFVLFQRLNNRHEYPGTGIGLALCKKIVDNHGGRIFAESVESIQTQFHVILPVVQ